LTPVVAGFPTRRLIVQVGAVQVTLLVVKRLEDYVDTDALLREADAPEPPYWAHVWAGSRVLARRLTKIDCSGRRVVDVGAGVGLAGIVAAKRGAAVTAIDTAHAAMCFARANAALNGCSVAAVQADLHQPALRGRFDYCLAADVTYQPSLQVALADFLATHLAPDGTAWCAESVRTSDQGFRGACERYGFTVTEEDVRELDDAREVIVRLTTVRQKR
jgi:2-polyprenyl-3-methyl-5-hydroxy-6-metoxy-1,4-benzoquinol methylase